MVKVGDKVKAGDPLFEIAPDPTPQEVTDVDRQLDSAKASYDRARAEFERAQELSRNGVLPKSELDVEARSLRARQGRRRQGRAGARAHRANGRIRTETVSMESIIRAPAAGTVLTRAVNPGDPVVPLTSYQPGTELATIADMSDLIFKGTVDEIDVGKLKVGLPARIKVGALPTDVVTGKVARIAPAGAAEGRRHALRRRDRARSRDSTITLRAGYSANADLIIREKKDVLTIPERLVTFEDGGKKTFVEIPGATPKAPPKKTEVKIGISDGLNVEVVEGVSTRRRRSSSGRPRS